MLISLRSYKASTKITGIQLFTGKSAKLTTIIVSQQNYINYITIFFSSPQKKASYESLHRMPHYSGSLFLIETVYLSLPASHHDLHLVPAVPYRYRFSAFPCSLQKTFSLLHTAFPEIPSLPESRYPDRYSSPVHQSVSSYRTALPQRARSFPATTTHY